MVIMHMVTVLASIEGIIPLGFTCGECGILLSCSWTFTFKPTMSKLYLSLIGLITIGYRHTCNRNAFIFILISFCFLHLYVLFPSLF